VCCAEGARQAAKLAAAAAGVAVGTFLTFKLKATRQSAAIIELANLLVSLGDPTALTREQVAAIESKYGTSLAASYPEELKGMYGAFVEAVVPTGDAPVTGVEPGLIQVRGAAAWRGVFVCDVRQQRAGVQLCDRVLRNGKQQLVESAVLHSSLWTTAAAAALCRCSGAA
jgi:hypothetical protein